MSNFDQREHRADQHHESWHSFDEEAERKRGPLPVANRQAADAATRRMAAQAKGPAKPSNEPFAPGTEVWVSRTGGYHHAGIYVGNNEMVHVFAEPMGAAKALLHGDPIVNVVKTDLSTFLSGASLSSTSKGPSQQKFSEAEVVQRANSRVGEAWSYNPLTHNCQHFTSWAENGTYYSAEAAKIEHAFQALPSEVKAGVSAAAHSVEEHASEAAGAAKEKLTSAEHNVEKAGSSVAAKAADAGKSLLKKLSFW